MTPRDHDGVTILFTDVQGSTELRARLGDQLADQILANHEAILRRAISEHGGHEVAFLGDGFMATFPAPADGLRCAVSMQQALQESGRADPDQRVRVRIGLHYGEAVERDGTLYGQAVHAASRVMSEAAGGQILITSAVREQGPGLPLIDRGLYWLRGFPERWRLYEVEWGRDEPDAAAGSAASPLVGRDRERADLRRAVDATREGRGSLVLIAGEAGVGKTRLLQEIDAEADAKGLRVLVGHCVRMEGHAPYLPFAEMIEQAMVTSRSPVALRAALGEAAPEIARIAPALRLAVPGLPAPLDLPPEQARRYLWLSMLEFIERAADERPLMMVAEDLHWADESTLLLLEYLAPHLAEMPVLMVGTYRDGEVPPSSPLGQVLNQLVRQRLGTRVALRQLSEGDVATMISGLAGEEPPAAVVRAIYSQSEGNPFFAEEIYFHLAESGVLTDDGGRLRRDLRLEDMDVPESVRSVIGERLARLSAATRKALAAAALRGRVFEVEVVERVVGDDEDDVLDAFDEAERARLIVPSKTDPSRYTFAHELIRATLRADTSAVRRRRLHARIADAIEEVHAADQEAQAADLAYHLSRAGIGGARLVRYLRIAGDRAMQAAAFADAVAHFSHAVQLLGDDRETRAELVERLAMGLRSLGRWDEALKVMDEALELYEQLGRADAVGRVCGALAYQLGWAARWEEAVAVATRGLRVLGDAPNPDRARLLAAAAWIIGFAGDYATATGMFAQARALVEELGDDMALADVLSLQTMHHVAYLQLTEGVVAGLRAAEVYDASGHLWDLAGVLSFAEFEARTFARPDPIAAYAERLDRLATRAAPLADRLGHLGAQMMGLINRVRTEGVFRADLGVIDATARRQVEVCERGGLPWLYMGHIYLGLAAHWRGDWDEAERELRLADQLEAPGAIGGQSAAHLAVHLARAGRRDEVLALVTTASAGLPAAGQISSIGAWNALNGYIEALYLVGETDMAAGFLPLVEEALQLDDWIAFDGRLVRTRAAIAATAARRWDDAEARFEAAFELAEALGNRIEQADLRWFRARMLLDRDGPGDPEAAAALAADAARRYRAMGMPRHAAAAETLLPAGEAEGA